MQNILQRQSVLFIGILLVVFSLLVLPFKAHAQQDGSVGTATPRKAAAQEFRNTKEAIKNTFQNTIGGIKNASTTGGIGSKIKDAALQKRDAIKGAVLKKVEDMKRIRTEFRKEKMSEKVAEKVKAHIERTLKKFNAAIERMEKLVTRTETAITQAESKGKNVTTAKTELAAAKANIVSAKDKLASVSPLADEAVSSTTPRAVTETIKDIAKETKDLLKQAHAHLRAAVKSIKPVSNTATTTATN